MPDAPVPSRPHPARTLRLPEGVEVVRCGSEVAFAELAATSNFTFLTGGSFPDELVVRAAQLGYRAIAATDLNSVAGIVRAHAAAKEVGMQFVVGTRLVLADPPGFELLVYPTDAGSYGRMCRLLTLGKRRADKSKCLLGLDDVLNHSEGLLAVALPPARIDDAFTSRLATLKRVFDDDRLSIAASCTYGHDDAARLCDIARLCRAASIPMLATNLPLYHIPQRRMLQDVLTCIRLGCTLDEAGFRLEANAERHLKPPEEMARLFAGHEHAIARTVELARRCRGFSLSDLRYQYPAEVVPAGRTPMQHLAALAWEGARGESDGATERRKDGGREEQVRDSATSSLRRFVASSPPRLPESSITPPYPPPPSLRGRVPDSLLDALQYELCLINELDYAHYFLTVDDMVRWAREQGILCQGRGAAANSVVCYCLGITSADPRKINALFERFISRERKEPPDIDIDFEHERREEVIQYLYRKYGRERAALTAEVITYRGRSAVREVGKALGLSLDAVDRLAKGINWWDGRAPDCEDLAQLKLDPDDTTIRHLITLATEIQGFPRHLSQHVGGFVITRTPLSELVPIENAAMEDRTVIEWDKDDIDEMGFVKVDVLGLGMLTCLAKGWEMLREGGANATKRRGNGATEGAGHLRNLLNGSGADDLQREEGVLAPQGAQGCSHGRAKPLAAERCPWRTARVDHRREAAEEARKYKVKPPPPLAGRITHSAHCSTGSAAPPAAAPLHPWLQPPAPFGADSRAGGSSGIATTSAPSVPSCLCPPPCLPPLRASVPPASPFDLLTSLPDNDSPTYDMICSADTVGVFQIESRAQMSMLPRLRPRCYYDLVIEVAIVRPGPIQGQMVHPYLRRRQGKEPVTFPDAKVEWILGKTLGVPLFQEQAMLLAIHCAGFTPDEADKLRRAVTGFRRHGDIFAFEEKLVGGMIARGYDREFAQRCFEQIKGFSTYGFPESHAASFAIIAYASAWMKCHYPAVFACALLNSQPMGFYQPAQIVADAQRHGVVVRPVDVNRSEWDCTLEKCEDSTNGRALRLGLRQVKGLGETEGRRIAAATRARRHGRAGLFRSVEQVWRASGVRAVAMRHLAAADAFGSMGLDRQSALWHAGKLRDEEAPLFDQRDPPADRRVDLPPLPPLRHVIQDYATVGVTLRHHPISFLRDWLDTRRASRAVELADARRHPAGRRVSVAGLCLVRQRPGTANGITFMTLEDESGCCNLVVHPRTWERFRSIARDSGALLAHGRIDREGEVVHVVVHRLERLDERLAGLQSLSRNFR